MQRFLRLYQESRSLTLLARDFRECVGIGATEALLGASVVRPRKIARTYPCPGDHHHCPRRIVPSSWNPDYPFTAVCGQSVRACETLQLRIGDVEEYTASHEAFARLLRQVLRLEGEFALLDGTYPSCARLGEMQREGRAYDVFLCRSAWDSPLAELLAERQGALRRSVVLVPTSEGMPIRLAHRYVPGDHVTLAFLTDALSLHDDCVVMRPEFEEVTRTNHVERREVARRATCLLIAHDGRRTITQREYEDIIANPDRFDLFIDTVTGSHSRKFGAAYRNRRGGFHTVRLSALQANVLAELMDLDKPIRSSELRCLQASSVHNPSKFVEVARRLVDVKTSRYQWRSFHTLASETGDQAKRYAFRPPPSLRYACLAPLGTEAGATHSKNT